MKLRALGQQDANRMLEWMHDTSVVSELQNDFLQKTMEDCLDFIQHSESNENLHLAIADENDMYMGTVSLKHITSESAEFAITICKDAMGKGYAIYGMKQMILKGFEEMGLARIYWCVSSHNARALRFYDKNHFQRINVDVNFEAEGYTEEQTKSYIWYQVTKVV